MTHKMEVLKTLHVQESGTVQYLLAISCHNETAYKCTNDFAEDSMVVFAPMVDWLPTVQVLFQFHSTPN